MSTLRDQLTTDQLIELTRLLSGQTFKDDKDGNTGGFVCDVCGEESPRYPLTEEGGQDAAKWTSAHMKIHPEAMQKASVTLVALSDAVRELDDGIDNYHATA